MIRWKLSKGQWHNIIQSASSCQAPPPVQPDSPTNVIIISELAVGEEKTKYNPRQKPVFRFHTIRQIELLLAPQSFKVDRLESILNGANFLFHYFGSVFNTVLSLQLWSCSVWHTISIMAWGKLFQGLPWSTSRSLILQCWHAGSWLPIHLKY